MDDRKKALFLGYDRSRTRLHDVIAQAGFAVEHTGDPVADLGGADCVISFGYRHILRAPVLATAHRPVVNLHIAFLPYNRGANPAVWAVLEDTPLGVTIHEIDAGIDTGPVIVQRKVEFPLDGLSFNDVRASLIAEIEDLFEANAGTILSGRYSATAQTGEGTFHRLRDLPATLTDLDIDCLEFRRSYLAAGSEIAR